jgi:hypothetical protein
MAKTKKEPKQEPLEKQLWKAVDKSSAKRTNAVKAI